jgi:hypothetical protein
MEIVCLVMTDGRLDCLDKTLASINEQVRGPISAKYLWDDSGVEDNWDYLRHAYRLHGWISLRGPVGREGFGGAIRRAWQWLADHTDTPFVFSSEDDFVYERRVDLRAMAEVLTVQPYLAQMALRRQPWNDAEIKAGGVVEANPKAFVEVGEGRIHWLEHREFWTTNASLFRRPLLDVGWPEGERSEGVFTHQLLGAGFDDVPGDKLRFGYWGKRDTPPWITHIGATRVGTGY